MLLLWRLPTASLRFLPLSSSSLFLDLRYISSSLSSSYFDQNYLYLVNLYNPDFNVRYKIRLYPGSITEIKLKQRELKKSICLKFILFQAHKSLEHCLATRAEILEGIGGTESAVEPAESADSMFTWAVVDGDNVTVPICDLQRELDKVRSKAGHVQVTREPFNSLSYQKCRRYCRFIA